MVAGSPTKRPMLAGRCGTVPVLGGGDSAAGPLTRRTSTVSSALRAISLEYSHTELALSTSSWNSSRRLGSGCYGAVYRGELKDGSEVAIKAIDLGALMGKGECPEDAGFDEEVQMLSKFRHPNLVTLLGWGQQGLQRYLVYEFLAGGDVFQRLHKSRQTGTDKLFHWHERLSVCLDASTGLSHMHNSTPKAFHRDIKTANILLDRHGTAKMADFGLSCTSGAAGALHVTVKTISGTPGYKCPIYERTGRFTEGSEVYSFGMVLLEVLTGLDPSAADPHLPGGITYPVNEKIVPSQVGALERCLGHLDFSASWPVPCAQEFGKMALRCVTPNDERSRPHFVENVRSLRAMTERYPPTFQTSAPNAGPPPAAHGLAPVISPQALAGHGAAGAKHGLHPAGYPGGKAVSVTREPHRCLQGMPPIARAGAQMVAIKAATSIGGGVSTPVGGCSAEVPVYSACEGGLHCLDLVAAIGLEAEHVPAEFRRFPLVPDNACVEGNILTISIGRHHQGNFFEAWLPDVSHRSCISRKALEISWVPGLDGSVSLLSCGTNPLSVDGRVAVKNTSLQLRAGSEISFTYEMKVLLKLRFHPNALPNYVQSASSSGMPSSIALAGSASISSGGQVRVSSNNGLQPYDSLARWSVDRTKTLIGDSVEDRFLGRAALLEGVDSVSDAVEGLNHGSIICPGGFCIVYSATKGAYFLLYALGMKEAAFACLGVSDALGEESSVSSGNPDASVPQYQPSVSSSFRMDTSRPSEIQSESLATQLVSKMRAGQVEDRFAVTLRDAPKLECRMQAAMESSLVSAQESQAKTRDEPRWRLTCTHSECLSAEALAALPADLRSLEISSGTTLVGRIHQPLNFEAWLPDPIQRFCVSRTHIEMVCNGDSISVTNKSTNPLCVDGEPVARGSTQFVTLGQDVNFASARRQGATLSNFLTLQVQAISSTLDDASRAASKSLRPVAASEHPRPAAGNDRQDRGNLLGRADPMPRLSTSAVAIATSDALQQKTLEADSPSVLNQRRIFHTPMNSPERLQSGGLAAAAAARAALSGNSSAKSSAASFGTTEVKRQSKGDPFNLMSVKEDTVESFGGRLSSLTSRLEMRKWQTPAATAGGDVKEGRTSGTPPIVLELCGDAVIDMPVEERCIGPISLDDRPLLVGRRHQPKLHDSAIAKEALDLISRDHFCVAYEGGEFWLLSLTANPVWRDRDGAEPARLARDDLATLLPGDRICLGIGSGTASAESARQQLCWHFRIVATDGPVQVPAANNDASRWMATDTDVDGDLDQTALDATMIDA